MKINPRERLAWSSVGNKVLCLAWWTEPTTRLESPTFDDDQYSGRELERTYPSDSSSTLGGGSGIIHAQLERVCM